MKKQFLTFTFLLLGLTVSAQDKQRTLGILVAPNMDTNGPEDSYSDRRISYATGVFYDHQLSHRFGISTGLLLDTERYRSDYSRLRRIDAGPDRAKGWVNAIEVPVNFTFCLNPDNESAYKAFLFSGIMMHRSFFSKYTAYYSDKVEIYKSNGHPNNLWRDSYMNLGFELRKKVATRYTGAIAFYSKFRPARSLDFSSLYYHDEPFILNLSLKFGRNL